MLVIALGDGIRAEAELLADLLQSHAGAHSTRTAVSGKDRSVTRNGPENCDEAAAPRSMDPLAPFTRDAASPSRIARHSARRNRSTSRMSSRSASNPCASHTRHRIPISDQIPKSP